MCRRPPNRLVSRLARAESRRRTDATENRITTGRTPPTGDPHRGEDPAEGPPPEGRATQGAHTEHTQTVSLYLDAEVLVTPPVLSASSCDRRYVGAGNGKRNTETESRKIWCELSLFLYLYIYLYSYRYMNTYIYTLTYVYTYIYLSVTIYLSIDRSIYMYIYVCIYIYGYLSRYIDLPISISIYSRCRGIGPPSGIFSVFL